MSFMLRALCGAVGLLGTAIQFGPTFGQTAPLKNPQVQIEYVAPRSPQFQAIYERLQTLQVLELLQEFLAPLRLPRTLVVKIDECGGALEVPYTSQQPVVICYDYILSIENSAPPEKIQFGDYSLTKEDIIVGGFVNVVLNQIAHAVFDIFDIPIWGLESDAADAVAAVIMIEFQSGERAEEAEKRGELPVVITTILGTTWFLSQRSLIWEGGGAPSVRPREGAVAQRFYNFMCMAYGRYEEPFRFLVDQKFLPEHRAIYCPRDYRQARQAFMQNVMPHVDQDLLNQVRSIDWAPRLRMTRN